MERFGGARSGPAYRYCLTVLFGVMPQRFMKHVLDPRRSLSHPHTRMTCCHRPLQRGFYTSAMPDPEVVLSTAVDPAQQPDRARGEADGYAGLAIRWPQAAVEV
jgi:hypothetical protein